MENVLKCSLLIMIILNKDYAYYSEDKINVFKRAFRINKDIKKNVMVEEGITNFKVET